MNDQSHHLEYRHVATQYMADNPEEYAWYFESKQEQTKYVDRMSKSGQWGGHMELAILSKILRLIFFVYLSDGTKIEVSTDASNFIQVDNTQTSDDEDDLNASDSSVK